MYNIVNNKLRINTKVDKCNRLLVLNFIIKGLLYRTLWALQTLVLHAQHVMNIEVSNYY